MRIQQVKGTKKLLQGREKEKKKKKLFVKLKIYGRLKIGFLD